MRRLLYILVIAVTALLLSGGARPQAAVANDSNAIAHIFTHELIFDTAKAYAPGNSVRACFDRDHMTSLEFKRMLNALYNNGYALVSLDYAINGTMPSTDKKPLIMSFDDMTYDTVGRGCIDKLILQGGKLCDYTASATPQITRERENVTILEEFIEEHPDFSFEGARATLCVNGYNGILGYRITPDCKVGDAYMQKERVECKALIEHMKGLGYTFASHTYYHEYFKSMSQERIRADIAAWKKHVAPIVGDTDVLCFPAGEHNAASAKTRIYTANGYKVFLCVGSGATDAEKAAAELYLYRRPVDGTALRLYRSNYAHLFDTKSIYDTSRYLPFSYKGGYR